MSERELPVVGAPPAEDGEPVCSPKVYVSNEEAAIASALRSLSERAHEIRSSLSAADAATRAALEGELEHLRELRSRLEQRREQAYRRKMVMLGHLPPEALEE